MVLLKIQLEKMFLCNPSILNIIIPSIKQQPVPVVYNTPLLLPEQQQKQQYSNSWYDEINDYI